MNRRTKLLEFVRTIPLKRNRELAPGFDFKHTYEMTRDPIYAIPESVLTSIESRLSGWFDAKELELERHYAKLCRDYNCLGLFGGGYVQHALVQWVHRSLERSPARTSEAPTSSWPPIIEQARAEGIKLLTPFRDQLLAYVGWLMTNDDFRQERDALKTKWDHVIRYLGYIPSLPVSDNPLALRELAEIELDHDEFAADFDRFHDRWHLKGMATWDLPNASGVNLGGPISAGRLSGLINRPALQLSSTVRLPARFKVQDVLHDPIEDHLADWQLVLEQRHPSGRSFGKWGRICQMHFLRNIVLMRDYGDRLAGHTTTLDWVFADYFGDETDDGVRKTRVAMGRRMT